MINYTDRIAALMDDIVARVPPLSFIDTSELLVFARFGRAEAEGAFATCHCLTLPPSEPGYYFWRDRRTGKLTRRSEWFVSKSPQVHIGRKRLKYLISFVIPRFCEQTLAGARKGEHYPGFEPWLAKLDTVVHELYHIDPEQDGIRRIERADGTYSTHSHAPDFYQQVSRMVMAYLETGPDPSMYDFLRYTFSELNERYDGVVGTTFRTFPSFPQRYLEALESQPDAPGVRIVPLKRAKQPTAYTEADLHIRQFLPQTARRLTRKGEHRAA